MGHNAIKGFFKEIKRYRMKEILGKENLGSFLGTLSFL
jgi:hypothetical protein